MATELSLTVNLNEVCGRLKLTDTTPVGSGNGYDTTGGMVSSSITSVVLLFSNLDGTHTGTLYESTSWLPGVSSGFALVDYADMLGVYQLTFVVIGLDDNGEPLTISKSVMALFDCTVEACLREKALRAAKQGCGCCSGCGNDVSGVAVSQMWTELEAIRITFQQGFYDCLDAILQSLAAKCNNSCKSC